MVNNNFNGGVYIETIVKRGDTFDLELFFQDLTSLWRGRDCQIGDVVFCKGSDGRGYRLIVDSITTSSLNHISCTVKPESTTLRFVPPQYCAIVRETPNRKFPMFPVNLPVSLRGIIESYYAVIDDQFFEVGSGTCNGNPILHNELVGTETFCIKQADGTMRSLSLTELTEYILTLTSIGGKRFRLNVGEFSQMLNTKL